MISGLILLYVIMGILFLIGIFSPRTKKIALRIKRFIIKAITGLIKSLPRPVKKIIIYLIIAGLLFAWFLKQKFLG